MSDTDQALEAKNNPLINCTAKELAFCEAFWSTGNLREAALAAGYSDKHLGQTAYRLRRKPNVIARLQQMSAASLEDLSARRGILVNNLLKLATSDIKNVLSISEDGGTIKLKNLEGIDTYAVKSLKETNQGWTIELHDKIRASELLARISGLQIDRLDVTSGGKPLINTPVNIIFEVVQPLKPPKDVTEDTKCQ